jgi:serine/threonine protein kinase
MAAEPQRDPMIGRLFAGRFQIEARVGSGGMGNIYRAVQVEMKRPVALKVLHPDLSDDAEVVARFDREMKTTTRIEHPNSVRVYEHGRAPEGQLYLAMELLDGQNLADAIADGAPFGMDRVGHIGMQIAGALAAAHAEKIVHRDLKPENIMLLDRYGQKDFVKVLDFGLSRFSEDEDQNDDNPGLTQTGVRVGTPTYMSPEYVSAFQFDSRSDLYALGIILYEMATGSPPFTGRPYEILEKQVSTKPQAPSAKNPKCPKWLDEIVLKLLAKKPADRPQDAMEVFKTLERGRARVLSDPTLEADELRKAVAAQAAPPPPPPLPEVVSMPVSSPVSTFDSTGNHALSKARARGATPAPVQRQAAPPVELGDEPTVELDKVIPPKGPITTATPAPAPGKQAAPKPKPSPLKGATPQPVGRRKTTSEVVEDQGGKIAAFGCAGAAAFAFFAFVLVAILVLALIQLS